MADNKRRDQYGASPDSVPASVLGAAVGTSASAQLSLRTELARTLQKTMTFGCFGLLGLAVLALVLGVNEHSLDEDVIALEIRPDSI
jgi:hypothetical protein